MFRILEKELQSIDECDYCYTYKYQIYMQKF